MSTDAFHTLEFARLIPCTFCQTPLSPDQLHLGFDHGARDRMREPADLVAAGMVAICVDCAREAVRRLEGGNPRRVGVQHTRSTVSNEATSRSTRARDEYKARLAEQGGLELEILAYRLGTGTAGVPHSVEETAAHYELSEEELLSLEDRYRRLSGDAATAAEGLDAFARFNADVMEFRLGLVDSRLHTVHEVCEKFSISESDFLQLERRYLREPPTDNPRGLSRLGELGHYERLVLAFRLGIGGDTTHTLTETAQHFRMARDEVRAIEERVFGVAGGEGRAAPPSHRNEEE